MKLTLFSIIILTCHLGMSQTPGEWTWISGTDLINTPVFGTQGIPSTSNTPSYSYQSRHWVDDQGNFWLYGGLDIYNNVVYNDLWRYNPTTYEWTWMKGNGLANQGPVFGVQGVSSSLTNPGICSLGNSGCWKDSQGNLWLLESSQLTNVCTLWKYTISLNEWTWISGNSPFNYGTMGIPSPLNNPEPFFESPVSWTDDEGDFWLLDGYNGGVMWEYDIATNQWTWMHGTPSSFNTNIFTPTTLGTLGVFSPSNGPGSGAYYTYWKANDGTFYLFGGSSYLSFTEYSTMCQFDPATNQWAWVGGAVNPNFQTASFVGLCVFDPDNLPFSTYENTACWVDECGKFWAYENAESYLWCYDPLIHQFAYVNGDISGIGGSPVFGTQGVSSPLNDPGKANGTASWTDLDGNLWRLGSFDMGSISVYTNVLWRYVIDPNCLTINSEINATAQTSCGQLTIAFTASPLSSTYNYQWDFGVPNLSTDTSSLANPSYTYTSAGNYTAQLIISGNVGCGLVSDTVTFNVTVPGTTTLITNDTAVCIGSSINLSATGAVTYNWSPAAGLNTTVGATVQASPTVTTSYIVTGTTGSCSSSDTVIVTVNPLPTINVNSPTICQQGNATLIANGGDTYSWTPTATLSSSTGSSITASPSVTTVYTVTGTDTTTLCSNTAQSTVTIEIPQITVNSDTNCPGNPADVSALTATGAATYLWSPSSGLSATSGATVTASPTQTTVYTVIGTTANGCLDTTAATVTVIPSVTVTVNSESICVGESLLLSAAGANTYSWSPAAGLNTTIGTPVQASPTATTSYIVTGTTGSCSSSDTVIVTVNPLPTINVNSPTICQQGNATLIANGGDTYSWTPTATLSSSTGSSITASPSVTTVYTVTGTDTTTLCSNTAQSTVTIEIPQITVNSDTNCLGNPADVSTLTATGASTYVWSPATGLSATTGATVTATPAQTTVYTVIGTTANGCLDTATATVTAIPDFTLTVNSDSICVGESVLLAANGATNYTWSPATGLSATTGTEVVANPTVTTVYAITGTTAGCSETTTSTVTVFGQPVASIFASPNPTSTVESTVTLQTSSNNNVNSTNWYLDDSLISQLNSFAYTFPDEPGSYVVQLIVTNALGCSDTGYVTIVVEEDIIFYVPNSFTPNDDDFNNVFIPIITSGIDTKNYAFNIFNRWGELIFDTNEIGVGWDGTYKGVKVQDGTYTWTLKFKSKYNDGIFEHTGHVVLLR